MKRIEITALFSDRFAIRKTYVYSEGKEDEDIFLSDVWTEAVKDFSNYGYNKNVKMVKINYYIFQE